MSGWAAASGIYTYVAIGWAMRANHCMYNIGSFLYVFFFLSLFSPQRQMMAIALLIGDVRIALHGVIGYGRILTGVFFFFWLSASEGSWRHLLSNYVVLMPLIMCFFFFSSRRGHEGVSHTGQEAGHAW